MRCFNGNHTKHFTIKLSAAPHLAAHHAFKLNVLFLWELYANSEQSLGQWAIKEDPSSSYPMCSSVYGDACQPPNVATSSSNVRGCCTLTRPLFPSSEQLVCIKETVIDTLTHAGNTTAFFLVEVLSQWNPAADSLGPGEAMREGNASLIWDPTVRERSNPLLLQSQQLAL